MIGAVANLLHLRIHPRLCATGNSNTPRHRSSHSERGASCQSRARAEYAALFVPSRVHVAQVLSALCVVAGQETIGGGGRDYSRQFSNSSNSDASCDSSTAAMMESDGFSQVALHAHSRAFSDV